MPTLKRLYKSLIQEEIKQNYFLRILNEAIKTETAVELSALLDEIERLINSTNIRSLKNALAFAKVDSKKVSHYKDSRDAENTIYTILTFYSKIWNFFTEDVKVVYDLLGTQFSNDAILNTNQNAKKIKDKLLELIIEDNSPWYRKALSVVTGDTSFKSGIPYLKVQSFIDEFMTKTKEDLGGMMMAFALATDPSTWQDRISASILSSGAEKRAESPQLSPSKAGVQAIPQTIQQPAIAPAAQPAVGRSKRVEMPAFDVSQLTPQQRAQLSPTEEPVPLVRQIARAPEQPAPEKPPISPVQPAEEPRQSVRTQPGFAQVPAGESDQSVQRVRRRVNPISETKLSKKLKQKSKVYR